MRWKVGHHDLKSNGVRVYYFYDSGGTTHICGIGYRVGAVHDITGVPHLVEHILFRGKPQDSENDPVYDMIFRYFGEMEAHNIRTDHTSTFYGGPRLYLRRHVHEVMTVLAAVLKEEYIDRLSIDIETTVVNNEFRQEDLDKPKSELDELFYQTMYDTNPVRYPIIGDVSYLRKRTVKDIKEFIRRFYGAENLFALIIGPSREEAVAIAQKYLDDWPRHGDEVRLDLSTFDRVPHHRAPRIMERSKIGLAQNYVMAGYPTEGYDTNDDAALNVIDRVLERRLYDVLRERSRGFRSGCYHNPTEHDRSLVHGSLAAWFSTASPDFAQYGRDAIVAEFQRFREELVPWHRFDAARDSLREKFYSTFRDSSDEIVEMVVESAANGDPDLTHLHSYPNRLNELTREKVRNVARKYFHPDGFVAVTLSPAK